MGGAWNLGNKESEIAKPDGVVEKTFLVQHKISYVLFQSYRVSQKTYLLSKADPTVDHRVPFRIRTPGQSSSLEAVIMITINLLFPGMMRMDGWRIFHL